MSNIDNMRAMLDPARTMNEKDGSATKLAMARVRIHRAIKALPGPLTVEAVKAEVKTIMEQLWIENPTAEAWKDSDGTVGFSLSGLVDPPLVTSIRFRDE